MGIDGRRDRFDRPRALHADLESAVPRALPEPDHQHPPQFPPRLRRRGSYGAAYERGVKLIGATAHYATEELDAGPIIEQDVMRVDHSYSVADMRRIGRYVERAVLARAVDWHLQDRIIVFQNKTIVFV